MRSRYRVGDPRQAYFVTSTIVQWLPVFTTSACCDILVQALAYCQEHKDLQIYGWVILDNHFHAILACPRLPRLPQIMAAIKRHTAKRLLGQVEAEGRDWLLNQWHFYRAKYKTESDYQVWQEGYHPEAIVSDEMMLQKLDYLHQNPVARGWVIEPAHWRYSSAHEWLPGSRPVLRCDRWR